VSPAGPYTFDDEMVQQGANVVHVQPVTLMAPLSTTCTFDSTPGDVIMPIFLDAMGTSSVLLPLHSLRLHAGTVSADHGCIGRFNAEGLDPANNCVGDATHPEFTTGASADGYILLEEADKIVISALAETLCVLLSGNASMYGVQQGSTVVCKRDTQNKIVFQGDWCAATNQAATSSCADSLAMSAKFAAQAVQIN
jgi:hypothetical protein